MNRVDWEPPRSTVYQAERAGTMEELMWLATDVVPGTGKVKASVYQDTKRS